MSRKYPDTGTEAVLRLFGDAEPATKSSPDSKVLSVIRTVVNRSVTKAFQSSASQTAVENAVKIFGRAPCRERSGDAHDRLPRLHRSSDQICVA